jgi:phosphate butyryltransferase
VSQLANRPYDELSVGDSAKLTRLCQAEDLFVFAHASGNHNPMHLPDNGTDQPVAPSMWIASLISAVLGNILPGPGTLYKSQNLEFPGRAHAGDELEIAVEVVAKEPDRAVRLRTTVERIADGTLIAEGEAVVLAPDEKISFEDRHIPGLIVQRHRHFDRQVDLAETLDPVPTAVVAPEEPNSLGGPLLAADHSLIRPILVGDKARIEAAAAELGRPLGGFEIVRCDSHREAAARAVALVHDGHAKTLMKGHLHTDALLKAVLSKKTGLRAGRRLTHVFVMDIPGLDHLLLITDAAINIDPDLATKVDMTQNAIDLAISLGIEEPRVGILSAVETVNPKIQSSVDGALLSKMADRRQITGGIVDGPLAMDNAINLGAARTKGITSPVAGRAEILVAPDLDAGNMLAKQLTYISHAEGAGLVLGAKVPIILTSRADGDKARLASCAVAALHHARIAASS